MKKSLLALAVLGAFAGAASAQSSVTIYGIVDASVGRIDNGGDSVTELGSGRNAASRIGFKGIEDLGNGLKASFVLENGFQTDNGAQSTTNTATFSRLAYVGLGGDFGTVRLGRQNSQIAEVVSLIDPFQKSGLVNGTDFYNNGVPERVSNQISYISNNYGGFSGAVGYRFGEVAGDNSANRGYGLQLGYANGPLVVQFAYDKANLTQLTAGGAIVPGGTDEDTKNALLGATYDFGAFKLHGAYGQKKIDDNAGGDEKIRSYIVGATVPFGASKIRAEYIRNDNRDFDADNSVAALSYTYSLSKRTTLYATYARINNDGVSNVGFDANAVTGENASGIALGVQHNF